MWTSTHFKPPTRMGARVAHVGKGISGDGILQHGVSGRELSQGPFSVLGVEMHVGETPVPTHSWVGVPVPIPCWGQRVGNEILAGRGDQDVLLPLTAPICLLSPIPGSAR